MALSDEIYMKHHVSELHKLDEDTAKLWKEGQDRWCFRQYGMTVEEFRKKKDEEMSENGYDGSRGYGSSGDRDALPKQCELPGQSDKEVPCSDHPDAPHGFNRNASHGNNRYTCDCEGWEEEMIDEIIDNLMLDGHQYQIDFMKGLKK
jgi:hypothetical protein